MAKNKDRKSYVDAKETALILATSIVEEHAEKIRLEQEKIKALPKDTSETKTSRNVSSRRDRNSQTRLESIKQDLKSRESRRRRLKLKARRNACMGDRETTTTTTTQPSTAKIKSVTFV